MKPIQKKDMVDQGQRIQLVLPRVLRGTLLEPVPADVTADGAAGRSDGWEWRDS